MKNSNSTKPRAIAVMYIINAIAIIIFLIGIIYKIFLAK